MNHGIDEMMKRLSKAPNVGEGGSKQPRTMWEQMEAAGTTRDFTKNLTIEGSSVHMKSHMPIQSVGKDWKISGQTKRTMT